MEMMQQRISNSPVLQDYYGKLLDDFDIDQQEKLTSITIPIILGRGEIEYRSTVFCSFKCSVSTYWLSLIYKSPVSVGETIIAMRRHIVVHINSTQILLSVSRE